MIFDSNIINICNKISNESFKVVLIKSVIKSFQYFIVINKNLMYTVL